MKKSTEKKAAPAKVVEGEKPNEIKPIDKQVEEARGKEEAKEDDGGSAALKPSTFPNADELKFRDQTKEARLKHLESLGIDPDAPAAGLHKVLPPEGSEKMYTGVVTVTGTDGQYGNPISTRIDVGPVPKGEQWLKNKAFKEHFPSADLSKPIKIDETNSDDPMLRTIHG